MTNFRILILGSGKSTLLRVLVGINRLKRHPGYTTTSMNNNINNNHYGNNNIASSSSTYNQNPSSLQPRQQIPLQQQHIDDDNEYYDSGHIYIDGYDTSTIPTNHRSLYFSMVSQDNELFRGLTLAENIRYGTHHLPHVVEVDSIPAKIAFENAVDDALVRPIVNKLGESAAVGPLGRFLSGGERQRVCIARALYREELNRYK